MVSLNIVEDVANNWERKETVVHIEAKSLSYSKLLECVVMVLLLTSIPLVFRSEVPLSTLRLHVELQCINLRSDS